MLKTKQEIENEVDLMSNMLHKPSGTWMYNKDELKSYLHTLRLADLEAVEEVLRGMKKEVKPHN